jgi:hypothetical protein
MERRMNNKIILSLALIVTHAVHHSLAGKTVDMNDLDFDQQILMLEDETDNTNWTGIQTRCTGTASTLMEILLSIPQFFTLLESDFYRHTNPINKRRILDLPYFTLHTDYPFCAKPWQYRAELLYNQTRRQYFTQDSSSIDSYINTTIDGDDFITDIRPDLDIPKLIDVVNGTRLEERRLALMLGAFKVWDCMSFEIKAPLEYQIRNYFLDEAEQEAIRIALNQEGSTETEMEFAREHLISDRIGLGDTRINLGSVWANNQTLWFTSGLQMTLATSAILTTNKGLYGTHFDKSAPAPLLDLLQFANLAIPGTDCTNQTLALQEAAAFFDQVLNRLSAMTLEDSLGMGRHCGFGLFYEHELTITSRLAFRSQGFFEYIVPSWEKRFYIQKKDIARIERIKTDPTTEPLATENLNFIDKLVVQTLFPTMYNTRVSPGFIIEWTGGVSGAVGNNWNLTFGYDFWMQSEEKLGKIDAPKSVRPLLKTEISKKPGMYQNKVFMIIDYERSGERFDWCCSANLDGTFLNSGVGKDVNIGLGLLITM